MSGSNAAVMGVAAGLVLIVASTLAFAAEPGAKDAFTEIALPSEGGTTQPAAFFTAQGPRAAVWVPGKVFNKESWYFMCELLQGFHVASLSLDGKTKTDVLNAVAFLKDKGFKEICLVGGSMGGRAVLAALEGEVDPAVTRAVLLAPAGGPPVKHPGIAKLFIVAKDDSLKLYDPVKKICEQSADPKTWVEYDTAEHAQHLFKGAFKEKLTDDIAGFLTGE